MNILYKFVCTPAVYEFVFPYSYWHLVWLLFFILVITVGEKGHLTVVLVCNSVITNGVECLFECYRPFLSIIFCEVLWGCRIVWCILTSRYLSSFPFTGVYNSCVWYFSCWFLKLRNKFYYVGLLGLGLAGGRDLGFGFPWNGGIPRPIGWPGASQSICTQ